MAETLRIERLPENYYETYEQEGSVPLTNERKRKTSRKRNDRDKMYSARLYAATLWTAKSCIFLSNVLFKAEKKKIIRLIPRNNDLIGLDECNLRLNEPAKDEETEETEREMFPVWVESVVHALMRSYYATTRVSIALNIIQYH